MKQPFLLSSKNKVIINKKYITSIEFKHHYEIVSYYYDNDEVVNYDPKDKNSYRENYKLQVFDYDKEQYPIIIMSNGTEYHLSYLTFDDMVKELSE